MKTVKKIVALLACVALLFTCFAACHEKGAIVATYQNGDKQYTVTSGVYLTMLINADSEARTKVTTALQEQKKSTENVKFSSQKVKADDGKEYKFNDYVIMRAKEMVAEYFLTEKLFDQYKLKLSDESNNSLIQYAASQWMNGGMYIFEVNGAGYESFQQYLKVNMFERSDIFDYLYGEKGEKAPAKADIVKTLKDNFAVAYTLEISTNGEDGKTLKEDELKKIADKLQGYADRINNGKATFADIKAEYEAETKKEDDKKDEDEHEDHDHNTTSSNVSSATDDKESDKEEKPLDSLEKLFGSEDSSASSTLFKDINKLDIGKATLLKSTDGYYRLAIKRDIEKDPYYFKTYRDETVRIMHAEDFNKYFEKEANKLEIKYDSYELNYLKPSKIDYDTYDEWYAGAMQGMLG